MQPGLAVPRHIVRPRPRADVGLLDCVAAGAGRVGQELDKIVVHIHICDDASLGVSDGQQVAWIGALYRLCLSINRQSCTITEKVPTRP